MIIQVNVDRGEVFSTLLYQTYGDFKMKNIKFVLVLLLGIFFVMAPMSVLAQDQPVIVDSPYCYQMWIPDDYQLGNWQLVKGRTGWGEVREGNYRWSTIAGQEIVFEGNLSLADFADGTLFEVKVVLDVRNDAVSTPRLFQIYLETVGGSRIPMFPAPLSTSDIMDGIWTLEATPYVMGMPEALVFRSWGGTDSISMDDVVIGVCPIITFKNYVPIVFDRPH